MKVIFIKSQSNLTKHKDYAIMDTCNKWYEIKDDNGFLIWQLKEDFISLSEYRDIQISSILD